MAATQMVRVGMCESLTDSKNLLEMYNKEGGRSSSCMQRLSKTMWEKLIDIPEFIGEGSEATVKLKNPEDYKTFSSKFMFSIIYDGGGDGEGISKKQKVCLSYNKYIKESGFYQTFYFEGSLSKFAKEFGPGVEEAIQGMKPNELRRIIIPPKDQLHVNNRCQWVPCISAIKRTQQNKESQESKEHIFLDVTLKEIYKASSCWWVKCRNWMLRPRHLLRPAK